MLGLIYNNQIPREVHSFSPLMTFMDEKTAKYRALITYL